MLAHLTTFTALTALTSTLAHMEMSWPYPYRSSSNPANDWTTIDYTMTQPLEQYPCKGYISNSRSKQDSVVSWAAGASVNYTVAGTALHGGGSCQLAMSYDLGQSWNVILSYMGGCMIEGSTTEFSIPSEAPNGDAIFAWSWFNKLGNREMYQNCAVVTITNGGSGLSAPDFPAPFVANVPQAPGCSTIENIDVVFPNPGKNVRYGGIYASTKPTAVAGISGSCATAPGSANNAAPAQSSAAQPSSVSSAQASVETLFQFSSSATSIIAASSATSTSGAIPTVNSTTLKTCKRRRGVAKRHERVLRRDLMNIRGQGGPKRVAAMAASYGIPA